MTRDAFLRKACEHVHYELAVLLHSVAQTAVRATHRPRMRKRAFEALMGKARRRALKRVRYASGAYPRR